MNGFEFPGLKGKVAVVTGGTGVLCSAICEALAAAGTKLAIIGINQQECDALSKQLSEKYKTDCIGILADVTDDQLLKNAREIIHQKLGQIDLLINGAGGNAPGATTAVEQILPEDSEALDKTFFGLKIPEVDKVFALNFKGTLLASQIFGEDMVKKHQGVILNISSMNSFRPLTRIPAYSAAKASVNNFTQWLAVHLAKSGIRVNAIAPGFFLTQQNRFLLVDEKTGEPTARGNKILQNTPTGKYGRPEDLQGVSLFLLSDLSAFITGVIIPVDGGYNAFGGV